GLCPLVRFAVRPDHLRAGLHPAGLSGVLAGAVGSVVVRRAAGMATVRWTERRPIVDRHPAGSAVPPVAARECAVGVADTMAAAVCASGDELRPHGGFRDGCPGTGCAHTRRAAAARVADCAAVVADPGGYPAAG